MGGRTPFVPLVSVVDFHHIRGPEVEHWFGVAEGTDPAEQNEWTLLPFLALSDGAHLFQEDFSYFTLVEKTTPPRSLFGIACTRQIDASELLYRPADVTRSAVQKAVVVITDNPQGLSTIREKLSMVTRAWFAQKDFRDCEILTNFQASIAGGVEEQDNESDNLLSLSLREIVHTFKWHTLVLFKSLLLQPKMLFFGTHCETICQIQFSLLSLIPGLLRALQDSADPLMDSYGSTLKKSTDLKTSDRQSLLRYMGLPLQIFGKGALLSPYTPLQLLDTLADQNTTSYVVGSTNTLLLHQRDKYADVLVNMDDKNVAIFSPSLKSALTLSTADRRWMDFLTQTVNDSWDPQNPSRPSHMGYTGSEEFIRLQFEEYLLALLSSIKYHNYATSTTPDTKALLMDIEGDPSLEFNTDFITAWTATENYKLFNRVTDSHIFDVIEPKHPCAGGLTIDDVQRRLGQQVQDLHLDEKWRSGREVVGKRFAESQKRIGGFIGGVWADVGALREAQRRKAQEGKDAVVPEAETKSTESKHSDAEATTRFQKPDLTAAQAQVSAASAKAGAYLSSWGSWAAEKRKGLGTQPDSSASTSTLKDNVDTSSTSTSMPSTNPPSVPPSTVAAKRAAPTTGSSGGWGSWATSLRTNISTLGAGSRQADTSPERPVSEEAISALARRDPFAAAARSSTRRTPAVTSAGSTSTTHPIIPRGPVTGADTLTAAAAGTTQQSTTGSAGVTSDGASAGKSDVTTHEAAAKGADTAPSAPGGAAVDAPADKHVVAEAVDSPTAATHGAGISGP